MLGGLSVHALFDGVAIGSGFVVSNWLGWLIFLAILLHKAPEGFTMASVMLASGRSRAMAFWSAVALAGATLAGVLVIELVPRWVPYGLPVSAGVALYVAATDLVPEVNREPGIRMALVFFAGVGGFLLLRTLLPQCKSLRWPRAAPSSGRYAMRCGALRSTCSGRGSRSSRLSRKRILFDFRAFCSLRSSVFS